VILVDSKANDVDIEFVGLIADVTVVDIVAGLETVVVVVVAAGIADAEFVVVETSKINLIVAHELNCNLRPLNSDLMKAFSFFIYN
jgi:hypothetical protein